MVNIVGRAYVLVSALGKDLPREMREIGEDAGEEVDKGFTKKTKPIGPRFVKAMKVAGRRGGLSLGKEFARTMNKSLSRDLRNLSKDVGRAIGTPQGLAQFSSSFDKAGDAVTRLRGNIERLRSLGEDWGFQIGLTAKQQERLNEQMDVFLNRGWAQSIGDVNAEYDRMADEIERSSEATEEHTTRTNRFRRAIGRLGTALRGSGGDFDKAGTALSNFGKRQRGLNHNFRQFLFWTTAIVAGAQDIAVLGAAAGAGILVLGNALTVAGLGGATLFMAFKGLSGELEDLPEEVRPAAKAFQSIGTAFKNLQKFVQIRALSKAEGAFDTMRQTVEDLTESFGPFADVVGRLVDNFAESTKKGTKNFERLQYVIEKSAPIFETLMTVIGRFGEGLLAAFARDDVIEATQGLVDWLGRLADKFLAFTESDEFTVWLDNAVTIFEGLEGVLEGVGTMMDRLVTPEAVDRTKKFLDNIALLLPQLGTLGDIVGRFDVFGLIAEGLVKFGDALEPLVVPMGDLADAVNRAAGIAIDQWAEDFGKAAEIAAPFVQAVADALADMDEEDIRNIAKAVEGLAIAFGLLAAGNLIGKVAGGLLGFNAAVKGTTGPGGAFATLGKGLALLAIWPGIIQGTIWVFTEELPRILGVWDKWIGDFINVLNPKFESTLSAEVAREFEEINKWGDEFFNQGLGLNNEDVTNWWNGLWGGVTEDTPKANAETAVHGMGGGMSVAMTGIETTQKSDWETFWTVTLPGVITNSWSHFTGGITTLFTTVKTWFQTKTIEIGTGWNTFWNVTLPTLISNAWPFFTAAITGLFATVKAWFNSKISELGSGWNTFWTVTLPGTIDTAWTRIRSAMNTLIANIKAKMKEIPVIGGLANLIPDTAAGGVFFGSQVRRIAEAGPEAVVPLRRPLAQVDPAVRALSAFAQGMGKGGTAGAAVAGTGKVVTIESGAIQVNGALDPERVAILTMNRLAERMA